jgi:hypothetical protein
VGWRTDYFARGRYKGERPQRGAAVPFWMWRFPSGAPAVHSFLLNNRDELIERCKHKVAQRPRRAATYAQLANGIPLFLDQLTRTLGAEEANEAAESLRISGPSGGDALALSEMGVTATAHGKDLLTLATRWIRSFTTTVTCARPSPTWPSSAMPRSRPPRSAH